MPILLCHAAATQAQSRGWRIMARHQCPRLICTLFELRYPRVYIDAIVDFARVTGCVDDCVHLGLIAVHDSGAAWESFEADTREAFGVPTCDD